MSDAPETFSFSFSHLARLHLLQRGVNEKVNNTLKELAATVHPEAAQPCLDTIESSQGAGRQMS